MQVSSHIPEAENERVYLFKRTSMPDGHPMEKDYSIHSGSALAFHTEYGDGDMWQALPRLKSHTQLQLLSLDSAISSRIM